MNCAIALTEPLSSISLPNSAPSRNSGKNCARNCAALPMKVWVQCASSGSPAKAAATSAAGRRQQQHAPAAKGEPDQQGEAEQDAEQAHAQTPSSRRSISSVERLPEIVAVRREEGLGRAAALVAQHG